ncbi:MAG: toxin-antitoxin system HicB family antitoxin [Dysosmobacter sp.]|nr:toxin-antitoxin system HicB family antitoxin [Dysosmobacter sp.]
MAAKLAAIQEEAPDELDRNMIREANAVNDGTATPLGEVKSALDFSGKLNIRIPKSLHKRLSLEAKEDGVSLNQYIVYKLSR